MSVSYDYVAQHTSLRKLSWLDFRYRISVLVKWFTRGMPPTVVSTQYKAKLVGLVDIV